MTDHISCDCKCKLNNTTCNPIQKWNNKTCHCECKNYYKCEKDLKSVSDTSVTDSDEVLIVMNNLSTKKPKYYE